MWRQRNRLNFLAATGQGMPGVTRSWEEQILSYSHQREHALLTFWLWASDLPELGENPSLLLLAFQFEAIGDGTTRKLTPHWMWASRWEPLPALWPTQLMGRKRGQRNTEPVLPPAVSHCCLPLARVHQRMGEKAQWDGPRRPGFGTWNGGEKALEGNGVHWARWWYNRYAFVTQSAKEKTS